MEQGCQDGQGCQRFHFFLAFPPKFGGWRAAVRKHSGRQAIVKERAWPAVGG